MNEERIRLTRLRCGTVSPPAGFCPEAGRPALRRKLAVSVFLAELPGRRPLLIDAGLGRAVSPEGRYDRAAARAWLPEHLCAFWRPETPPGRAPAEQLRARGVSPAELEGVLLTTLEPDHVTGLPELAGAGRIWLPEQERFWTCRTVYALRQPRRAWEAVKPEVFYYRGTRDGPVLRSLDLLGDGRVICVSTPGYTEGLCAVELRSPSGRFALIQSDLALTPAELAAGRVPLTGFNREFQRRSLRWLRERSRDGACAGVFFGHDPAPGPDVLEF